MERRVPPQSSKKVRCSVKDGTPSSVPGENTLSLKGASYFALDISETTQLVAAGYQSELLDPSAAEFGDRSRYRAMRWTTYHFVWEKLSHGPCSYLSQLVIQSIRQSWYVSRGGKLIIITRAFDFTPSRTAALRGSFRSSRSQTSPVRKNIAPFDMAALGNGTVRCGHEVLIAIPASPHSSRFRSPSPFSPPGL